MTLKDMASRRSRDGGHRARERIAVFGDYDVDGSVRRHSCTIFWPDGAPPRSTSPTG